MDIISSYSEGCLSLLTSPLGYVGHLVYWIFIGVKCGIWWGLWTRKQVQIICKWYIWFDFLSWVRKLEAVGANEQALRKGEVGLGWVLLSRPVHRSYIVARRSVQGWVRENTSSSYGKPGKKYISSTRRCTETQETGAVDSSVKKEPPIRKDLRFRGW